MPRTMPGVALVAASLCVSACSTISGSEDPPPALISEITIGGDNTRSTPPDPGELLPVQAKPEQAEPEQPLAALPVGQVGYYMDIQEAKFRQLLSDSGIEVARAGNTIILSVPERLSFAANSARLKAAAEPFLDSISTVLLEFDKTLIRVLGHTDHLGAKTHNQELSVQQGKVVAKYLQNAGVSKRRLQVVGYGDTRPIAPNNTQQSQGMNRRIELVLEPISL